MRGGRQDNSDEGELEYDTGQPVPYQARNFKSSTLLKMVSVPQRHPDAFYSKNGFPKKKGIILHTDRYQWDEKRILENRQTQRERMQAEMAQLEKLRNSKRKLETKIPHRVNHGLLLGGTKIEFEERVDISGELDRLKALVLPPGARELFVGKGFMLPENHQILKPRKKPPPPTPQEDTLIQSAPPTFCRKDSSTSDCGAAYTRECSCTRLPALPKMNTLMRRGKKRKSIDETNLPSISRRNSKIGGQSNKPSTSVNVSNIRFENPVKKKDMYENCEEKVPDWAKEDDDDNPEADVEIKLPASARAEQQAPVGDLIPIPGSPMKSITPNPLKAADLKTNVSDEERNQLSEAFRRLDTDSDGHLLYQQLKTQFPEVLSQQQERYLKVVYDITSASTYFGIEEFITLTHLMQRIENLSEVLKNSYEKIDMLEIKDDVIQYVELFESLDRESMGVMSMESIEEILSSSFETNPDEKPELFQEILPVINPENQDTVSKMDFLSYIPYFIYMKKSAMN
ncbi:uncharacterized protein LOC141909877 isoform X2 [Tubulanus polymorphus]